MYCSAVPVLCGRHTGTDSTALIKENIMITLLQLGNRYTCCSRWLLPLIIFFGMCSIGLGQTEIGLLTGEKTGDEFGFSVSQSADGSIVAIGAPLNDGFLNRDGGHVRVFKNQGDEWVQLGSDIDGKHVDDQSGFSVSLSADGSVLAIGAISDKINFVPYAGYVRVFKYDSSNDSWTMIGDQISGRWFSRFGSSVSLSADGSIVAIGGPYYDGLEGSDTGYVQVYKNDGETWYQVGNDIKGEEFADRLGLSVSLSADGSVMGIGVRKNSSSSLVRVYENRDDTWVQVGDDIEGPVFSSEKRSVGTPVSLSADGSVVAIGGSLYDGENGIDAGVVRVYENRGGIWTQIGDDIEGESAYDASGFSVSLSANGSIVAIGAPFNERNGNRNFRNSGHIRIYENQFGSWTQVVNDIDGYTWDNLGYSVSLSADGSVLAAGGIDEGEFPGHVKIFDTGVSELSTDFLTFTFEGQTEATRINYADHIITVYVSVGTNIETLVPEYILVSGGAHAIPESGVEQDFSSPVTYTVNERHNISQEWTVNVVRYQEIDFDLLKDKTYGDDPFSLSATASSDLPVTYSATGPVTVDENELSITGVGTVTITAYQSGNDRFTPAPPVTHSFSVEKTALFVAAEDKSREYGTPNPEITFIYTGFVYGEDISTISGFEVSPQGKYAESATILAEPGSTHEIIITNMRDLVADNYLFLPSEKIGKLEITKAHQQITFPAIAPVDLAATNTVTLTASSDSNLPVTYALEQGDGELNGNTLTVNDTGNFMVTASQGGNSYYQAAQIISQSFLVLDSRKSNQSITFDPIDEKEYGDEFSLKARASSELPVTYKITLGTGRIKEDVMIIEGVGLYEITSSQAGNHEFNPAPGVTRTFNVVKSPLTVIADDHSIAEGDEIPDLTLTYEGFKLSDDVSVLDEVPNVSTIATSQSDAGSYPIVLAGGSDDHYILTLRDGMLTVNAILGTDKKSSVVVYPNPATDLLRVKGIDIDELVIYNLNGQKVGSSQSSTIPVRGLSPGTYILKLLGKGKILYQQRFIVSD